MRYRLFSLVCAWLCVCACAEAESDPQPNSNNNVSADMAQPGVGDMQLSDLRVAEEDMVAPQDSAPDLSVEPDLGPVDGCGKDHPRVGWSATLTTRAHGVRGTAVIVDNCTVEVRSFFFDGRGLDVKLYGAKGTNFRQGWPMSGDLLRSPAYMNETVIGKLPQGRTLDDLDAISVWCVDVPVDFGSGSFKAP